jgi:hypothetical protein
MRNIKDILRLKHVGDLSHERIAIALGISKGVVTKYAALASAAGLSWEQIESMDEAQLHKRLIGSVATQGSFVLPNYGLIHQELRRKGMTLMLLWEEHVEQHGQEQTHRYAQFCVHYREYAKSLKRTMRQIHRGGEKLFIDFAGTTVGLHGGDRAHIFVAALGASSYTFACATARETMVDWLGATAKALTFIGGVTQLIVPDNPKAMIAHANRTSPGPMKRCRTLHATMALPFCLPGPGGLKTKRSWSPVCRLCCAGLRCAFATSSSIVWMTSTRPLPRCWKGSTTSRFRSCQAAGPVPLPLSMPRLCRHCLPSPGSLLSSKPSGAH